MKREKKSQAVCWLEQTNPLRGMSIRDLQAVFDTARMGDSQRLHWIFQEIEALNPALLTCVERRASAVANFNWSVSERASQDGTLSQEQRDALVTFLSGITNFSDMLEHLDLAFFRGFAHAQPVWEADGSVKEVQLLDSWKFLRKGSEWFYNPACNGFTGDCVPCANARLLTVTRRRPIDYPALGLHVRHAVGSRDWGRFLERYALPKPAVFMHPGATDDQKADYLEGAAAVENGQVSVWPNGAVLTDFAGGSRGTDPFLSFIDHQEKQIILLATGGTLMSLAEAGTGTLAGNAQSDVWDSIVRRDSGVLASAISRSLVLPFLEHAFPGRPVTVDFAFDFDVKPTPKEVLELNALAKQGGYTIAQDELEDAIGFTLVKDEGVEGWKGGSTPFLNKSPADNPSTLPPFHPSTLPSGQAQGEGANNVLAAFARDTGPAADAIRELLAEEDPEALKAKSSKLIADLPSLLPEDPALAAVIAEAMAAEFGTAASGPVPSDSSDGKANKTDANGQEHAEAGSDNGGQFVSKDGGDSGAPAEKTEKIEHKSADPDTVIRFLSDLPKKITSIEADALLTTGFTDIDGEGNHVKYGTLLRDHIDNNGHSQNDIDARKSKLGIVVRMVRETKPIPSGNPDKPNERIYFGFVEGKAYVAVADEHKEIESLEMVSFRRDGRRDKR